MSPKIKLSEMIAFFRSPTKKRYSPLFAMSFKRVNVDLWKINDMENKNKPAYPVSDNNYSGVGLTKREYFAGLAMQGLLATSRNLSIDSKWLSEASIKYADELLKQLND